MNNTMPLHEAVGAMKDKVASFFRDAAGRVPGELRATYCGIADKVEQSAEEVLAPCCAAVDEELLNEAFQRAATEMPHMMRALGGTEGFTVPDSEVEIALLAVEIKSECIRFLAQLARITDDPELRTAVNQCILREHAHKNELIALVNSYRAEK